MYYWTDRDEVAHVLDVRSRPPSEPLFGYMSLCEDVLVPHEGEHFELHEDTEEILCDQCEARREYVEGPDEFQIARWEQHLVKVDRDPDSRLRYASLLCMDALHRELEFEPPEFSGNLSERVEQVCDSCWEAYTDQQWAERPEGAQLAVEIYSAEGEQTYYAESLEAHGKYTGEATLVLVSPNELTVEVHREDILDITLTPSVDIVY